MWYYSVLFDKTLGLGLGFRLGFWVRVRIICGSVGLWFEGGWGQEYW